MTKPVSGSAPRAPRKPKKRTRTTAKANAAETSAPSATAGERPRITADELRQGFLDFFAAKDHVVVPSDALIPSYDPTLLFSGAGMNQFKDDFLGRGTRDYRRAASSQKCLRTQDLDVVGRTFFHHTFFEMLGNFSFGDYFKDEAIVWAWEYFVSVLGLAPERLAVAVYTDDDEAARIWRDVVGVPETRIYRFGARDNYWPANAPFDPDYRGPCGPCSEIHYDLGTDYGAPEDDPSSESNRWCEVWNLVFQQFNKVGPAPEDMEPLPAPGIDTGMGFERLLALVNGQVSNFQTHLFTPLLDLISRRAGRAYAFTEAEDHVRMRRIADHARAAVFCVADGVWVGNTGRDYVLRKMIRRAVRDARQLGIDTPFLHELVDPVIELYCGPYPALGDSPDVIRDLIRKESEEFLRTLDRGERKLDALVNDAKGPHWIARRPQSARLPNKPERKLAKAVDAGELDLAALPAARACASKAGGVLSGEVVFDLEQTDGFPGDLTRVILEQEHGLGADDIGYTYAKVRHILLSRGESSGKTAFDTRLDPVKERFGVTEFVGYDHDAATTPEYVVLNDDGTPVTHLNAGDEAELFAAVTPFYAEAGGQIGDAGDACFAGQNARVHVLDCRPYETLRGHRIRVESGRLDLSGAPALTLTIDTERRDRIRRNHTATHLLHWALREVLGTHVHQKGSLVAPERLRFDFTHQRALTPDELAEIERRANAEIIQNHAAVTELKSPEEAKAKGAMALFGEKYGEQVRVLTVGPSIELCGGTHVRRSGDIGAVRIVGESAVGAGVRRIEAITGMDVVEAQQRDRAVLDRLAHSLKATPEALAERVQALQQQIKELRKSVQKARTSGGALDAALASAHEIGGHKVIVATLEGAGVRALKEAADVARQKAKSAGVALFGEAKGAPALVVAFTRDLVEAGADAGRVFREIAPVFGGKGGGRKDLAQGGGGERAKLGEAVKAAHAALTKAVEATLT